MIKIYSYEDFKPFSYFSITCYVALLTSLSCLFLPMYTIKTAKINYSMLDLLSSNFPSVKIFCGVIIFCIFIIFLLNFLFEPSWITFFIDVAIIIFLFISPTILKSQISSSMRIYVDNITTNVGSMVIMISAIVYIILEIYKISKLDEFVNRSIVHKRNILLQFFQNSKRFYATYNDGSTVHINTKNYKIQPILKSHKKFKKSHIIKNKDYAEFLTTILKI